MHYENLVKEVCAITNHVGQFIKEHATNFKSTDVETKGLNDFVSYVDKTAEQKIVEQLQPLIPDAGFITEEKTLNKKSDTYNWIIDPLDGTTNFIHGIPCYCISIALMHENELVLGVIHELNLNECFYSWKGGKAYLNDTIISVSDKNKVCDSLIATGFPYTNYSRMKEYMDVFTELMHKSHGIRRLGSAAVDLAYVACGRFEVFYEYGLNPWDVAAGAFIVKQAGGNVSDFKAGEDYIFGEEIVASNTHTHNEFMQLIKSKFQ